MRIAIVGTGIAGLTAAHGLHHRHEITVFEEADRIGGHTATMDVCMDDGDHRVDTGFIVYNDWTYPRFIELMEGLGVRSRPTDMSFSVSGGVGGLEYGGSNLNTLFAQRRNLVSPGFWRMIRDIIRFNRVAVEDLADGRLSDQTSLGDYLESGGYSIRFRDDYLIPMAAAIWSAPQSSIVDFPVAFFVRFFRNHGLLSINDRPQWRTISGGSSSYLEPLTRPFRDRIRLSTPVDMVRREASGVLVHTPRGGWERFDEIVLACHSDQALRMLERPSPRETEILGAIPYQDNEVVLHTDIAMLPSNRRTWSSWNYRLFEDRDRPAVVTYNMNILQGIRSRHTFCVTLNHTEGVREDRIIGKYVYAHPVFTRDGIRAQQRWREISGQNHTWFAGAYWKNGFHEDGVVSGLRVADAIDNASAIQIEELEVAV